MSKLDYIKIKNLAASKRIPIKELARLCDLSEQGFHYMLKKQSMRVDTLERICDTLGVTPMELFQSENINEELSSPSSVIIKAKDSDYNDVLIQKLDTIIDLLRVQKVEF
ncbi:MAG: helix-turn-helix domain-containing protein [Bacteroidia bacterium]